MYVCAPHVCSAHGGFPETSGVVSCHLGAENRTQAPRESSTAVCLSRAESSLLLIRFCLPHVARYTRVINLYRVCHVAGEVMVTADVWLEL